MTVTAATDVGHRMYVYNRTAISERMLKGRKILQRTDAVASIRREEKRSLQILVSGMHFIFDSSFEFLFMA